MATNSNPNPGSGLTSEDLEALKAYIEAQKKGENPPPAASTESAPPPASESPKFTVKIGGKDITGTQEEITAAFSAYDAGRAAQVAPPPERKVSGDDGYDKELARQELVKRLENDPKEGFRYGVKLAFGYDPIEVIQNMAQTITAQNQQIGGLIFRDNHPDYEHSQENLDAMQAVMSKRGIPPTFDGLEMAYTLAKAEGLIKVKAEKEETPVRATPPPRVSRSAAPQQAAQTEQEFLDYANTLSADELFKLHTEMQRRAR